MAEIRVWAPTAQKVTLNCNQRALDMTKGDGGWWSVTVPLIRSEVDYTFCLDGDGPFPDPRSPWQPQGVHGPSRWLDHAAFTWTDSAWQAPPLAAAVIYELHVGTFTPEGTFDGVIGRLDHLLDLGITHLELMPVAEFAGERGWGYDGVNLYAPHHAYGGPAGLKRLVDACHRRGLAVLLDVVYNHLGPEGNYLQRFGPYFTHFYATPWGEAVNLDRPDSDEVRRFLIDNALMWLRDYHLDGLRIDAVHAIVDTSATHFLEQLSVAVKTLQGELGRHLVLIAESDLNDPRLLWSPERGGYGLDAQWNEDFHHALHGVLSGEQGGYYRDFGSLAQLAKVLKQGFAYDGCYSVYRRRRHGRSAQGLSGERFVGCLQNHDQVGNRAQGERTSHLLSIPQLKIGAALVMTSPFVPLLFQGEEWGASTPFLYFTDHQDSELADAVKRGRQEEFAAFGWDPESLCDPQSRDTFLRSKLDWEEPGRDPHRELVQWYRSLKDLRDRWPQLRQGRMEQSAVRFHEEDRWWILQRGAVAVICNFADVSQRVPCEDLKIKELLLASGKEIRVEDTGLILPKQAVALVLTETGV